MIKLLTPAFLVAALTACNTTSSQVEDGGTQDVSLIEDKLTSAAFEIADADGDGAVTLSELQAANPETTEERFRLTDGDSSGTLSPRELEIGIDRRGGFVTLMTKIDEDGDGRISAEEEQRFDQALAAASELRTFEELKRILD